jgi:dihydrofolate synthase/folylpolyglutamate synthase
MSYEDALGYLNALGVDAMKGLSPSLHRIEALVDALNHPESGIPAIHVTGTNGKTSSARIASSLLAATGLTVGTYTSPHLQTIRERIAINGRPIEKDAFADVFDHLLPYVQVVERNLGEQLSFFEILTGMFFLWSVEQPVDAVVVEVGLGGRWDATNVVPASVAVVTNVGLDHTGLLGMERETIAKEKAGIAKPNSILVTAERSPNVQAVIASEAEAAGAEMSLLDRDFALLDNTIAVGGRSISLRTSRAQYEDVFLPLHGAHQGVNAAVAAEAVAHFLGGETLLEDVIAEGFAKAVVPGRLESIRRDTGATVVLDVAHNPEGMSALVQSLVSGFAFDRVTIVLGILADKDHRGMLGELTRLPCRVLATEARNVRSVPREDLVAEARSLDIEVEPVGSVEEAVSAASASTLDTELICVTGSHYVVGEARTRLLGDPDAGGP